MLAGQLGIIGSATSPDSSTQSSSQSTDKADGGHSSNGSGTDNANGTGGVGGTDGADGDNQDTVTDNSLKIVESGWSADQQGYVHYAFALRNTSKTQQVQYPQITITGRAKDGSIVFSQTQALNMTPVKQAKAPPQKRLILLCSIRIHTTSPRLREPPPSPSVEHPK